MTQRDFESNLVFLEKYGSSPQILLNAVNLSVKEAKELEQQYLKIFDKIQINDKK